MSKQRLYCSILGVIIVLVTAMSTSAKMVVYPTITIEGPTDIRFDKTKTVPFTIKVTTPDKKPYSGTIEVWPGYAHFVEPSEQEDTSEPNISEKNGQMKYIQVTNGKASGEVSLVGFGLPNRNLSITAGLDHTTLGQLDVMVRYPKLTTVSEGISVAKCDGVSHATFNATVVDQVGEPLDDVDVNIQLYSSTGKTHEFVKKTDSDGIARIAIPGDDKPGYWVAQATTKNTASQETTMLYTDDPTNLQPIRDIIESKGLKLEWDKVTSTAVCRGLGLSVRLGEKVAWIGGRSVPLGSKVQIRNGRIELPKLFVQWRIGSKVAS